MPARLDLVSRLRGARSESPPAAGGRLIHGENLAVMAALFKEFEGQIDLIYADPPFLSGNAYSARVGRGEDSRRPDEWTVTPGYSDTWDNSADYLNMLFPRLQAMHRLLSPTGALYLHLDWHASAYARLLLDEIFGPERLLNEIVWVYHGPSPIRSAFNRKHDTILVYTKTKSHPFNADKVRVPYAESTLETFKASPRAGFGKKPDLERGKVPEDWWYFPVVARLHRERTGYPTQKPEALLERIILASCPQDGLVADFFCGSGTALAVASRLNRRWIGVDQADLATLVAYRRLLLMEPPPAIDIFEQLDFGNGRALTPKIKVHGESLSLELVGLEGSSAPQEFPDSVVVWEVDWDYDGSAFTSRAQGVRSFGQETIATAVPIPSGITGTTSAVRVFDSLGRSGMTTFKLY